MVKLSIIIPALNEEDFLSRLLESIKIQSFTDYEIILSDAGSTDKTIQIASDFGCKIVSGGLPAKGRNAGAKAATADLLLFLDADTKLPSRLFLENAIKEFKERNLDVSSCRLLPLEKSKVLNKGSVEALFKASSYLMIMFEKIAPFGVGSMILVKKELHRKVNGFDEKITFGEDTIYIRKAAKVGKFGILRSVKILWSVRRFDKEKWIKPGFLYLFCWFIIGLDEKKLNIFDKGFFQYRFGHYKENKSKNKYFDFEKIMKFFSKK
ncbi:MAG: glycosyltransferase [Candidatus Parcubacteria bacterium]|nr:glycosyltransferase [Candidatus Parcubacteria bacterium]